MKLLTTILAALFGVMVWAQTPPPPDEKGTIPGAQETPIDDYIILAIPMALALIVAYWFVSGKKGIKA